MIRLGSLDEGLDIMKALGSDIRTEIVRILIEEGPMNMNELAGRLDITNGALTSHIKKLMDCGLVEVKGETSGHGNQKICSVAMDKVLIDVQAEKEKQESYTADIKVGQFSDYNIEGSCGLATSRGIIGEINNAGYYSHPEHYDADVLWLEKGYIEYIIPNLLPEGNGFDEIVLSMELGNAISNAEALPAVVDFSLNGHDLGRWFSPGYVGSSKGLFTPPWWDSKYEQHGLLKMLVINHHGTFVDGLKISDTLIDMFKFDNKSVIKLRMETAEENHGFALYGKGFGNYNQDIDVKVVYSER
ncbi:MAG: winged helix-turn-helix transcriptional regulator [Catonella sp.]|nr:winged helix-turn-helix transcriptional regulator [Catonella sp.]MDY6357157.1 winged helix-turn-helix transcriptional regulator [Catonella sp.]